MKKYILIGLLLSLLIFTTSCSKVKEHYYKQIEIGDNLDDVINLIGKPNEVDLLFDMYHSGYYWFDKADSLEEAKELAKKGKKIYYILVITQNQDGISKIIGKQAGFVYEELDSEEVALYA